MHNIEKMDQNWTGMKQGLPEALNRIFNHNINGSEKRNDSKTEKNLSMITKVSAKPNPFSTTITLDVSCEQSKHVIVRMFDADNKIVKMFSWYLVVGTNVTAINELRSVNSGSFLLDIVDHEGNVLFSTQLTKK